MNNEPVAWMYQIHDITGWTWVFSQLLPDYEYRNEKPLYIQNQLEEARKLGMQQERALWNLSESTQEIMNTHLVKELDCYGDGNVYRGVRSKDSEIQTIHFNSVKELTDDEIWKCHDETDSDNWVIDFARAILRKAQEK